MNILDKGFVELIEHMGDDKKVEQCARVSFGYKDRSKIKETNLIDYLIRNHHETPLEHVVFTFHVKAPIFVARQWFRHRIATYSEISGRYKELNLGYYIPDEGRIQSQSKDNKQGSSGIPLPNSAEIRQNISDNFTKQDEFYKKLLDEGVCKEIARAVLPVSAYTEFIWTINLRSLMNFLKLRMHEHAQYEIREYANAIYNIVFSIVPKCMAAFNKHIKE